MAGRPGGPSELQPATEKVKMYVILSKDRIEDKLQKSKSLKFSSQVIFFLPIVKSVFFPPTIPCDFYDLLRHLVPRSIQVTRASDLFIAGRGRNELYD